MKDLTILGQFMFFARLKKKRQKLVANAVNLISIDSYIVIRSLDLKNIVTVSTVTVTSKAVRLV